MNSPGLAAMPEINNEWRQRTISELFHTVSQPLTGLHCLLEVALMKKQTAEGYRRDIQKALEATSRLVESLRQARELAEAQDPGPCELVNFPRLVQEIAAEFGPLLEAMHIKPIVSDCPEYFVRANPEKLRRCMFYLFDNVLHDLPLGSDLFVSIEPRSTAKFYIGPRITQFSLKLPDVPSEDTGWSVSIAKRALEAVGGRLCWSESPQGRSFWGELPQAEP
jgi:signal transduction histidine kinase